MTGWRMGRRRSNRECWTVMFGDLHHCEEVHVAFGMELMGHCQHCSSWPIWYLGSTRSAGLLPCWLQPPVGRRRVVRALFTALSGSCQTSGTCCNLYCTKNYSHGTLQRYTAVFQCWYCPTRCWYCSPDLTPGFLLPCAEPQKGSTGMWGRNSV